MRPAVSVRRQRLDAKQIVCGGLPENPLERVVPVARFDSEQRAARRAREALQTRGERCTLPHEGSTDRPASGGKSLDETRVQVDNEQCDIGARRFLADLLDQGTDIWSAANPVTGEESSRNQDDDLPSRERGESAYQRSEPANTLRNLQLKRYGEFTNQRVDLAIARLNGALSLDDPLQYVHLPPRDIDHF